MPTAEKTYPGSYRAGDSLLHQLDPRLKILLLCVLMACLFSATTGWRILLVFPLWLVAARVSTKSWRDGLKVVKLLRWLLLFTLLLHLFFTPGRTLFGTSWLSYDGLLRGLMVNSQLLMAVLFSLLLAWTTKPESLTRGLTSLLSPLQRFKLPVRETGGLLLLVLQFFPLIREEVTALQGETEQLQPGLSGVKAKAAMVVPLLLRLVDRADKLAVDIAAGNETESIPQGTAGRCLTRFDWVFSGCIIILLALLWMV